MGNKESTGLSDLQVTELLHHTRETNKMVNEMHTTIFGAQGQGGLIRAHEAFKQETNRELAVLQRHREEITVFKAKLLVVVSILSTIASFFGSKIAAVFNKTP